ncbi:MAG: MFS transporter [Micrococcus sp.]|nr:MFS transporter [Micrococcus sp.]
MRRALTTPSFLLLSLGFFVCGFHVVFVATHLPAHLADHGLDASVGSTALALIGLFNVFGSLAAGWLGSRFPKPRVLAGIYALRTVAFIVFLVMPLSAFSVYLFAAVLGLLWLSTVPLTNGVVAVLFSTKNLGMLSGVVFLGHQIGAFLGGWLGGVVYEATGTYTMIWWVCVGLSAMAALVSLRVIERPMDVEIRGQT